MRHGVVEALGERGPLERQTSHPSRLQTLLNFSCRIELAHPKREVLLLGPAERQSCGICPADSLHAERLIKKRGHTLLACHLRERGGQRLVRSSGRLTCDEPLTQESPHSWPPLRRSRAPERQEGPRHVTPYPPDRRLSPRIYRSLGAHYCNVRCNIHCLSCIGCHSACSRWPGLAPTSER